MKKVLAIALALVMALSCGVMAFAAEEATDAKINETYGNAKCGYCDSTLGAEELMVDHLKVCPKAVPDAPETTTEKDYIDLTLKEVLNMIVDLAKSSMSQWGDVETIVNKIIDFFDGLLNGGALKSEVDGLVAQLEGLFDGFEIPGIDDLINALKEKILSFYAPGTVVPTTEPAPTEDTGSAPVGIAVFAAVSVAAAAAFVCTKKKD